MRRERRGDEERGVARARRREEAARGERRERCRRRRRERLDGLDDATAGGLVDLAPELIGERRERPRRGQAHDYFFFLSSPESPPPLSPELYIWTT
jgi:hypothetical protein